MLCMDSDQRRQHAIKQKEAAKRIKAQMALTGEERLRRGREITKMKGRVRGTHNGTKRGHMEDRVYNYH